MNANHPSPTTSGYPASAMLGTSSSACDRILLVTASACNLPSLICGTAGGNEVKAMGVCPASVEPIANPALLKGTCTRSRPSNRRKCSPTRCGGVPVPGEAKLYLAGPDLINATRSSTVRTANDGWTVSTVGE